MLCFMSAFGIEFVHIGTLCSNETNKSNLFLRVVSYLILKTVLCWKVTFILFVWNRLKGINIWRIIFETFCSLLSCFWSIFLHFEFVSMGQIIDTLPNTKLLVVMYHHNLFETSPTKWLMYLVMVGGLMEKIMHKTTHLYSKFPCQVLPLHWLNLVLCYSLHIWSKICGTPK